MIKLFACRDTKKLFNDRRVRRFQAFERQARKRLMVLNAAPSLKALMLNPGNAFHALEGKRQGQYAISINKQWRVRFELLAGLTEWSLKIKPFSMVIIPNQDASDSANRDMQNKGELWKVDTYTILTMIAISLVVIAIRLIPAVEA